MGINKLNSILLVDDEEISRFTATIIIQRMGFAGTISSATNGLEALAFLKESRSNLNTMEPEPLLILLDINMPMMDGFEFLEELNNSNDLNLEKLFVAMLSSSTDKRDMEKASEFNISGFLVKPLSEKSLAKLIDPLDIT